MKTARNRGDVPAPHVPSHGEKSTDKTAGEIIFDVDSLSFVDDWVKGDGQDQTFEHQLESSSRTPSNQKQRLGVGAIPEKSKQKVAPSQLEKKLLRKRQRREQNDTQMDHMDAHGVVTNDDDIEGESKTASFKDKKKCKEKKQRQVDSPPEVESTADATKGGTKSTKPQQEAVTGAVDKSNAQDEQTDGVELIGQGVEKGRKRKARRKKKTGTTGSNGMDVIKTQPIADPSLASTHEGPGMFIPATNGRTEASQEVVEGTKKRRGWGKLSTKPTAAPTNREGPDASTDGGNTADDDPHRRPPRRKKRSRQKNIRKDKRPMDQRPAHLRLGNPEYSGRELTDETRKILGLPGSDPKHSHLPVESSED